MQRRSLKPRLLMVAAALVLIGIVVAVANIAVNNKPAANNPKSEVLASEYPPIPNGQAGNWNLIFSDEFDGTNLDLNKWRPNWLGSDDTQTTQPINELETSCYKPSQVSLLNGELRLTAVSVTPSSNCVLKNGSQAKFASGIVQSNSDFKFQYGYAEAKIWTPAGTGMWPAFWSNGQNWPYDGEIDTLEAYGTDASEYHYHYSGCGGDCNPGGVANVTGATTGWHTYATSWEPGLIRWYYDGVEVWHYNTAIISSSHYLILNLGLQSTTPIVPATMRVDYVRVWKPAKDYLVLNNDTWKYNDTGADLGGTWKNLTYDDSSWKSGKASLGYAQGDETTVIGYGPDSNNKYITSYFRKTFNVTDKTKYTNLKLDLRRDDGVIVYLNGTEVARSNMPSTAVTYTSLATDASDDGYQIFSFDVSPSLLVNGNNVLAVEVHQSSASSSDLTMQAMLTGIYNIAPTSSPVSSPVNPPVNPPPATTDVTAPVVNMTSPLNNANVKTNTNITMQATATDNVKVTKVEFYVNSTLICTVNTSTSYSCNWKVPGKAGTSYLLRAKAYDAAGNSSISSININSVR